MNGTLFSLFNQNRGKIVGIGRHKSVGNSVIRRAERPMSARPVNVAVKAPFNIIFFQNIYYYIASFVGKNRWIVKKDDGSRPLSTAQSSDRSSLPASLSRIFFVSAPLFKKPSPRSAKGNSASFKRVVVKNFLRSKDCAPQESGRFYWRCPTKGRDFP